MKVLFLFGLVGICWRGGRGALFPPMIPPPLANALICGAAGGAAGGAAIVGGIPVAPAGGAVLGINELATSIKQSIFCCIFWVDTLFGLIL